MQTLPRCAIVVGIFICYSLNSLEAREVPCEYYPFHPECRGIQTKRSSIQTNDETSYRNNAQRLEDLFGMTESSGKSPHSFRSRNKIDNNNNNNNNNNNLEKSRLWTALFDRGLNPEAMYDLYLAHLEKNGANRQKFMFEENYPANKVDLMDGDY